MALLTRLIVFSSLSISIAYTDVPGPVGLITEATGTTLARAGLENVGVPAYKGDLLFSGDVLTQSAQGRVVLSFCPTSAAYAAGEGKITVTQANVLLNGKSITASASLPFCRLPFVSSNYEREVRTASDRLTAREPPATGAQPAQPSKAPLEPFDSALKRNPTDLIALLGRAISAEGLGLYEEAAGDYQEILRIAPQASWAQDEMHKVLTQRDRVATGDGKTLAVVIGISAYPNLPPEDQLHYADRDAEFFYQYLLSNRGGARQADVALLLNENAKSGDVKVAIANAFAHAKRNDRVVLFIASHGHATKEGNNRGAYLLTYDTSDENLADTAIRMEDLNDLFGGKLRPQQIQLFVDACDSGSIDLDSERRFKGFLGDFLDQARPTAQVLGMLASRQKEPSYECSNLDAGHGVFTYFVIHGLNAAAGEAVDAARGQITVDSLFEYVRDNVRGATRQLEKVQTPEIRGNIDDRVEIAKRTLAGLPLASVTAAPAVCESARGLVRLPLKIAETPPPAALQSFTDAVKAGRILPGTPGGAYDLLNHLQTNGSFADYQMARNQLLAALLNAGQEIILRYLRGEQVHMTRADFAEGEQLFEAAGQLLSGGDSYVNGRRLLCKGRRLIFDNNLQDAVVTLREAIRLDQTGAYSYNALGIAFLEEAQFPQAINAFQDAVRLAPSWAYARHNLALAYTQNGQYTPAIATYQQAMRLGPEYSYIPFNLGLLLERLNRPEEARELWQQILKSSPKMTRTWIAIGVSYFLERRIDRADEAYRTALAMADDLTDRLAVRHNLALLLVDRSRLMEAVGLWQLNLKEKPDDLPSLVGLSSALAQQGNRQPALATFSALLAIKPNYSGARLQYARLLIDEGDGGAATVQLKKTLETEPHSSEASELLGDLYSTRDVATAVQFYRLALTDASSTSQRRRVRHKIEAFRLH